MTNAKTKPELTINYCDDSVIVSRETAAKELRNVRKLKTKLDVLRNHKFSIYFVAGFPFAKNSFAFTIDRMIK